MLHFFTVIWKFPRYAAGLNSLIFSISRDLYIPSCLVRPSKTSLFTGEKKWFHLHITSCLCFGSLQIQTEKAQHKAQSEVLCCDSRNCRYYFSHCICKLMCCELFGDVKEVTYTPASFSQSSITKACCNTSRELFFPIKSFIFSPVWSRTHYYETSLV